MYFLVVLKTETKKVLSAGTFKGCFVTFCGCSGTSNFSSNGLIEQSVESVLPPSSCKVGET